MSFQRLLGQLKQIVIAVDQLVNTLALGWADETFSARCWRMEIDGSKTWRYLRIFVDVLLFFDKDHCKSSYESEQNRAHLPVKYRS